MQGGSSGIGYGLKYQVSKPSKTLTHPSKSQFTSQDLFDFWISVLFSVSRLDAYPTLKPTQITPAFSPVLSVSKKKTRLVSVHPRPNPKLGVFCLLDPSLMELNFQVHLIRLSSGGTELVCEGLFSHPNEIWDLASCPFDQRIFSTVYSTGNHRLIIFWIIR